MNEPLFAVRATVPARVSPPFQGGTLRPNDDGASDAVRGGTALRRRGDARARQTLRLLAAFRALRRVQLEAFLFDDQVRSADSRRVVMNRVVRALRERGLVQTVVVPGAVPATGASRAYVLSAAGRRLYASSDAGYPAPRIRTPSTVLLEHAVALGDIALAFRDAATRAGDTGVVWESDWEVVARIGSIVVIPDAFLTLERRGWRTRAFIEADRATERVAAFERKIRRYIELYFGERWREEFRAWPLVLTVTTSEGHARSLGHLAHRVAVRDGAARIARSFRFTSLDQLRTAGPLAPIWHVGGCPDRVPLLELPDEVAKDAGPAREPSQDSLSGMR